MYIICSFIIFISYMFVVIVSNVVSDKMKMEMNQTVIFLIEKNYCDILSNN